VVEHLVGNQGRSVAWPCGAPTTQVGDFDDRCPADLARVRQAASSANPKAASTRGSSETMTTTSRSPDEAQACCCSPRSRGVISVIVTCGCARAKKADE
jgi:hypothetical protein